MITSSKSTSNYLNRVGRDISAATNVSEALRLADLDFKVELEPIYDRFQKPLPRQFGAFRQDTRESLGVNGNRYRVLQTQDAFGYIDRINDSYPLKFRRGGLLKQGKFFLSAEFDAMNPGGDIIVGLAIFLSSFDGTFSNRVVRALERPACMNVATFGGNEFGIAAKHTDGAEIKIDKFMDKFLENAKENEATIIRMQNTTITHHLAIDFTKALFGGRESKQVENKSDKILELFHGGIANNGKTAWDWFNGVSEFETHHFTRRETEVATADENAFDAVIRSQSLTARAYEIIMENIGKN